MGRCSYCGKSKDEMPFTCKRCGESFCGDHRLPEAHNCKGLEKNSFFKPLAKKQNLGIRKTKSKSKSYERPYEMYIPGKKSHYHHHFSKRKFNLKRFLEKYIYFRIQEDVRPHLMQFLFIFIIGIVLNFVYYQTFSLSYLFIGGLNEWFSVLMSMLNYGTAGGYDLFYLVINGLYYAYFYYSFILVIYHTITNLNKRNTWVMIGWITIIIYLVNRFLPQLLYLFK